MLEKCNTSEIVVQYEKLNDISLHYDYFSPRLRSLSLTNCSLNCPKQQVSNIKELILVNANVLVDIAAFNDLERLIIDNGNIDSISNIVGHHHVDVYVNIDQEFSPITDYFAIALEESKKNITVRKLQLEGRRNQDIPYHIINKVETLICLELPFRHLDPHCNSLKSISVDSVICGNGCLLSLEVYLSKLEHIEITNYHGIQIHAKDLPYLPCVRSAALHFIQFDDNVTLFKIMPNIELLELSGINMPVDIFHNTRISELSITSCSNITEELFAPLKDCLMELNIDDCNLNQGLSVIENLRSLQSLYIVDCILDNIGYIPLHELPYKLTNLQIHGDYKQRYPHILSITGSEYLVSIDVCADMIYLHGNFRNVKELKFDSMRFDASLFSNLTSLRLREKAELNVDGLVGLLNRSPRIEKLWLCKSMDLNIYNSTCYWRDKIVLPVGCSLNHNAYSFEE